jgi:ribonuclease E
MLDNEPRAADSAASEQRGAPAQTTGSQVSQTTSAGSTADPEPTPTETRRTPRRRAVKAAPADETDEAPAKAPRTTRRRKAADKDTADESGASSTDTVIASTTATRRTRRRTAAAGEDPSAPAAVPAVPPPPAESPAPVPDAPVPSIGSSAPTATGTGPADPAAAVADQPAAVDQPAAADQPARTTRASRSRSRRATAEPVVVEEPAVGTGPVDDEPVPATRRRARTPAPTAAVVFMAPQTPEVPPEPEEQVADAARTTTTRRRRARRTAEPVEAAPEPVPEETPEEPAAESDEYEEIVSGVRRRRRRGRRGRGRGKGTFGEEFDEGAEEDEEPETAEAEVAEESGESDDAGTLTRRRRRRRRKGTGDVEAGPDDPAYTVVKIREPRAGRDEVQGVTGSTRLEAKRQRRRDGREQRRTRPPILSESEFLARREAVDRVMVIRQRNDRTQIAVLEDGVLVEHYVTRSSSGTMAGNVYLGRVQNVLPSMEAAFVDIGRGRNAVLYAGEVNWDATGLEGRTRTIEQAMKSGDSVLVQVTKDPIGTKGARLTSHIALSGRHLVYVPHGNASGISRKLSDVERKRLRDVLKNLVPDGAGVIVRTAAEGATEDELARDVKRLQAQWEDIQAKAAESNAPALLYEEPDLVIRVVRDLFNEDFRDLVIQGNEAYEMVEPYLEHVSPDLVRRVRRHAGPTDAFAEMRIDEQLIKGLDRKVFLPSGGHLVIDRTEAMTVIDVNTGKYTGAGGNLEETVTRNNLEAAEEIVRQLRLRDLGGIIVIDFIDMVLESNRELVLRRLTECLGRDRTKHQVTEITSLGLVQMTRKRVGQGLLEAFSETCEVCKGRGLIIYTEPVPDRRSPAGRAVAAAASGNGASGETADEPAEASRGTRRRSRRSGNGAPQVGEVAAPAEEPLVAADAVVDLGGSVEPDADLDDEYDEPSGLRRRTRRGGTRRRTRP